MAYILIKDGVYYPLDRLSYENDVFKPTEYFEVDKLLAYPISVLNNKGYVTLQCCEGHPLSEVHCESEEEFEKLVIDNSYYRDKIFKRYHNVEGENYICFAGSPITGAFVIFDREIKLSSHPKGWIYEKKDNSIRWNCENILNPTDYYKKLISAIEMLTEWAQNELD